MCLKVCQLDKVSERSDHVPLHNDHTKYSGEEDPL